MMWVLITYFAGIVGILIYAGYTHDPAANNEDEAVGIFFACLLWPLVLVMGIVYGICALPFVLGRWLGEKK